MPKSEPKYKNTKGPIRVVIYDEDGEEVSDPEFYPEQEYLSAFMARLKKTILEHYDGDKEGDDDE